MPGSQETAVDGRIFLLEFFIKSVMFLVVVTWGGRRPLHFLKMAGAAASVVFRDVSLLVKVIRPS